MSLINEALKKAQKENNGQRPVPTVGGGGHHAHVGGYSGGSMSHLIKWVVIGVVLLCLVGWGVLATVMYFSKERPVVVDAPVVVQDVPVKADPVNEPVSSEVPTSVVTQKPVEDVAPAVAVVTTAPQKVVPAPVTQQPANRPAEAQASAMVAQVPVVQAPQRSEPVVQVVPQASSKPVPQPMPQPVQSAPVSQPVQTASVANTAPVQESSPSLDLSIQYKPQVEEPMPKPEIVKAVFQLKIAAVMGRGGSTRIMVDGQVYRSGEVVDYDLMYKFVGKKGSLLYFIDQDGVTYEKRL